MSDETQVIEESNELVHVPVAEKKTKKRKGLAAVAAGAVVGVGAIAYDAHAEELQRLTAPEKSDPANAATPSDSTSSDTHVPQDSVQTENHPAPAPATSLPGQPDVLLLPDHIHVINAPDHMTFDEAFAWARETEGPAQLFEWNGELYHTCHAGEYDALPEDLKTVFETLWIANASAPYSVIGVAEDEVVYDLAIDQKTDEIVISEDLDATNEVPVAEQPATQPDSVSMDNEVYDFTYTEEDFDNNFEGSDEWVNEDDIA